MATAKSTAAEITEIQRRMAQVRRELHEEVREAVKGAQSLTDWRSQVRHHPWLALGAAAAVGYLIVPRRRQEPAPTIVAVTPHGRGRRRAGPRGGRAQEEAMGTHRLGRGPAGPHRGAGRAELRHPVPRAVDRRAAARGRGRRSSAPG